jgi:uncharacterized membrane protein
VTTAPSPPERATFGGRGWLVAVLAIALAIRLWHLGARSLWTDEGSTWTAASAPLPELIRLCAEKDASPPLFYLLTSLALRFGESEATLRLVSVLASVGLVWLTYRIVRLYAPRTEATGAAVLTASSPYQLMFAQEARSYALVAFLAVASLYLYLRAVYHDRPRDWRPYVAVTTLAFYTQAIAGLAIVVQLALALCTREGRRRLRPWAAALAACVALYVPWLVVSLGQFAQLGESHWYLEAPGGHELVQVTRAIFLSPIPLVSVAPGLPPGLEAWIPRPLAQLLVALVSIVPILAVVPLAMRAGPKSFFTRVMLAALLLPLAAVLAVAAWKPLWLARYFVFLTPFWSAVLARGLTSLQPRPLRSLWTALVLAVNFYAISRYDAGYTKEPWRDVVRAIGAQGTVGETAALVTFDVDPFRFYNVRLPRPVAAFEVSHPEVPFASDYDARQLAELTETAARRTAEFDDVWVVVRSPNSDVRREVAARAEAVAAMGRRLAGRWRWDATNGPLRVVRYVRGS